MPVKPYKPVDLSQPGIKTEAPAKKPAGNLTLNERLAVKALTRSGGSIHSPLPNLDIAPAPERKFGKDELKADIKALTQRVMDYLKTGNRLEQRLEFASLKDITVMLGILTDKNLLLEGQPTQIIGHAEQAKLDQIGTKLQELVKQRGLDRKITLTERTATIESA
jgi:cell division protein ZapA (FtsZ GTPase activity inhibitor)